MRILTRRRGALAAVLMCLLASLALVGGSGQAAVPTSAPSAGAGAGVAPAKDGYRETRTLTRTFVDADGAEQVVASRDVTVSVDRTTNLRGRQRVRVSWSGAQPSGGRAINPYGENGLQQEYPVVIMQCRGLDDPSLPVRKRLRPETCWTTSVAQRSQLLRSSSESVWLDDLYATEAEKQRVSGISPFPTEACAAADQDPYATHLTAFLAANGTSYPACAADAMPPEAAVGAAFPAAEIAAFTDLEGNGSVQFELRTDVENESLGCNDTVACSLVVIPIMGISCDQPSVPATSADKACRRQGRFPSGASNFTGDGIDAAVGPALWWSASNWRNRFSVPLTFGLPPDTCDVLDTRPPTGFYGSELLAQAGLQWAPAYCLNKNRFKFQLNRMPDAQAWNLMESGEAPAAVVSSRHETEGPDPVGYAPTAVSGFGIGYVIDRPDNAGEYGELKLNPRLLAKLLTQSYLGSDLGRGHPGMGDNPLAIVNDPEFVELNPGLSTISQEAAATLLSLSESSDVIRQLTEYIAQDEDAMAFVSGTKDPWGMVVNPSYRGIELPREEWPLLDTYVPETENSCRQANPVVYFTAIAAPVTTLRKISDALLDAWPNVQTRCDFDQSTQQFKLGRIDRQSYGARFMLGVVSLGDAARYGLRTAALETRPGRFVEPTPGAMTKALRFATQPDGDDLGAFDLDLDRLLRSGSAYPGTMIISTAARTRNLDETSAAHVAQFIRVATSEGQRPGSGNGRLPEGYVPIKRTGPTAALYDVAQDVAAAVAAQTPAPSEEPDPDEPDPDPGPAVDPVPDPVDPDDAPPSTDPVDEDTPGAEVPVVTTEVQATSAGTTGGADAGMSGALIPLLFAGALLGGLASALLRFLPRPPRPGGSA